MNQAQMATTIESQAEAIKWLREAAQVAQKAINYLMHESHINGLLADEPSMVQAGKAARRLSTILRETTPIGIIVD